MTKFTKDDTTLLVRMIIHDMDAPLAVIERLMSRICIGRFDPKNDTHSRLIRSSTLALDRVRKMLRDMQEVIGGQPLQANPETIELKDLAKSIVQEISPLVASEGQRMKTTCKDNRPVTTDTVLIKRVAVNFITNAIYHNEKGHPIELKLFGHGDSGYGLKVINYGSNIPEEHINDIFEAGVQLDMRANRKFRGHGLGLAFCKMVADVLGGNVEAKNLTDTAGVCFSIVIHQSLNFNQKGK
ncbi:MAG: histidine kinase [Candidatus Magnetoglobus multicellularis str. Araruama]|uniref:histidine kinase n=1 Tax=Candidatus Magnetoglobus multicellularis str. Araruama TaxID=890399 RepID=A0A1V1P362_9BACT|nr:MAG: histidine kinase [Candidatus Magnetoglobus multicellularis str. Araruama]